MAAENWRPIPDYEDLYSVSDLGRVRRDVGWPGACAGRILRPWRSTKGYNLVGLRRDGERRKVLVHRLVMLAFVGECPEGQEVRHLNGRPDDNRLSNLEYGTSTENRLDVHRHGGRIGAQKLTLEQVAEIRRRLAAGETQTSVAARFGVSQATISNIKTGRRWGHRLDLELAA